MTVRMFRILGVVAVGAAAMLAGKAEAAVAWTTAKFNNYSCSDANYGTSGIYWQSGPYLNNLRSTYTPECASGHTSNTPGSVVTAVATLRAATTQVVGLIGKRIAQVRADAQNDKALAMTMDGNGLGLAAGDKMRGIGIWVQGAYTNVKDTNAATKFDGDIVNAMVGIDYQVNNRFLIGIAGGYESSDLDTTYNKGKIDGTGWMVSPYASFAFNQMFSVDVSGGYAWLDYDMDRKDPITNETLKGKTDATRYWGSANLNAIKNWNKFRLSGLAGALYTKEKRDAFTETSSNAVTGSVAQGSTDSHLGQGRLGVTAGYNFGIVEPYVKATGEFDFSKTKTTVAASQAKPSSDDFGVVFGAGLNLNFTPRFKGMIEGNSVQFRDNYDEWNAVARLRVEF